MRTRTIGMSTPISTGTTCVTSRRTPICNPSRRVDREHSSRLTSDLVSAANSLVTARAASGTANGHQLLGFQRLGGSHLHAPARGRPAPAEYRLQRDVPRCSRLRVRAQSIRPFAGGRNRDRPAHESAPPPLRVGRNRSARPGLMVGGGDTATDWVDVQADYTVNEVAINWNAPLAYPSRPSFPRRMPSSTRGPARSPWSMQARPLPPARRASRELRRATPEVARPGRPMLEMLPRAAHQAAHLTMAERGAAASGGSSSGCGCTVAGAGGATGRIECG